MRVSSNHLHQAAALLQRCLDSQFHKIRGSDDRAAKLPGMLLQDMESFWVGLVGNDHRTFGLHDASFGLCYSCETSTCTSKRQVRYSLFVHKTRIYLQPAAKLDRPTDRQRSTVYRILADLIG